MNQILRLKLCMVVNLHPYAKIMVGVHTSGAKIVKIGVSHGKKCQRQRLGFVLWSLNAQMQQLPSRKTHVLKGEGGIEKKIMIPQQDQYQYLQIYISWLV
jgi:hypothetical protein